VWAGECTRARTPEARQRAFDGFVNRISAAIRRAPEVATPQTVPGDVMADWDAIADYVALAETRFDARGDQLLPTQSTLSIASLRARLGHVHPAEIDTAEAIAALRALLAVSQRHPVSERAHRDAGAPRADRASAAVHARGGPADAPRPSDGLVALHRSVPHGPEPRR